jgi:hypothetical protein
MYFIVVKIVSSHDCSTYFTFPENDVRCQIISFFASGSGFLARPDTHLDDQQHPREHHPAETADRSRNMGSSDRSVNQA